MKRAYKVVVLCLIGATLLSVIVVTSILLLNRDTKSFMLEGPAMSPTLQAGQEVKYIPYPDNDSPQRGDIVLYTSGNGVTNNKNLVHRIIGVPGDKVVIMNGTVAIFNSQHPQGYSPDDVYLKEAVTTMGEREISLSSEEYFVLGDNRQNSLDSRVFGPIQREDIIGKIEL